VSEGTQRRGLPMSETDLQAAVVDLARQLGYLVYHTFDSRKSTKGFPDLVLVHKRSGNLLVAELKDATRKVTPEQDEWLRAFALRGAAFLWRPEHWRDGTILRALHRYARTLEDT
jgi:VRR-NUC domain